MDLDETMVENEFDDEAADDALPEGVIEEDEDESEETLESFTEEAEQPEDEPPQETAPKANEPGWIKKRVEKAVSKAVAETEARMQAMFDRQMAPIREKMLEDEAQELVRSRKVGDIETARELVRLRSGQPAVRETASGTPASQPRNANGQFAPKEDPASTAATNARINMLMHQANRIRSGGGPDVIAEFKSNPDIKKKVINGDMDFYDVAENMKSARRNPPAPVRSSNGASGANPNAIESMSDEAFARLEKRIQGGARIRMN